MARAWPASLERASPGSTSKPTGGYRSRDSQNYTLRDRRQHRRIAESLGLAIEAVVTSPGLSDTLLEGAVLDLPGAVAVARDLQSPLVTVHVRRRPRAWAAAQPLWTAAVRTIRRAAEAAEPHGIAILLDAVAPDFLTPTPESVGEFLSEVDRPNTGWNLDPAMVFASGYSVEDAIQTLAGWVRHAHVKDVAGPYPECDWLLPGDGVLVHSELASALKRIGFNGAVAAEVIARPPRLDLPPGAHRWPLEAVQRSYATLQGALA